MDVVVITGLPGNMITAIITSIITIGMIIMIGTTDSQ